MERLRRLELSEGYVELLKEADGLRYGGWLSSRSCERLTLALQFQQGIPQEYFLRTSRRLGIIRSIVEYYFVPERGAACCRRRGTPSGQPYRKAGVRTEAADENVLRRQTTEDTGVDEVACKGTEYHR